MLQITLDSAVKKQKTIQTVNSNNWGFKLHVVNEGDSAELRVSFYDDASENSFNNSYNILPDESNNDVIGDSLT